MTQRCRAPSSSSGLKGEGEERTHAPVSTSAGREGTDPPQGTKGASNLFNKLMGEAAAPVGRRPPCECQHLLCPISIPSLPKLVPADVPDGHQDVAASIPVQKGPGTLFQTPLSPVSQQEPRREWGSTGGPRSASLPKPLQ